MSRTFASGRMLLTVALVDHHLRAAGLEHRGRFVEDIAQKRRKLDKDLRAILLRFDPLLKSATKAANAREDELRKDYERASARSGLADQISGYIYIFGTVAVLIGTALDKLVEK